MRIFDVLVQKQMYFIQSTYKEVHQRFINILQNFLSK